MINSGNLPLIYDSGNHNDDDEDFWGNIQGSDKQVELIYSAADCAHLPKPSKRSRW